MEYFILFPKAQGPYTLFQLRRLGIRPSTYVWKRGWKDWKRASEVEEIRCYVLQSDVPSASASTSPPIPPVVPPVPGEPSEVAPRPRPLSSQSLGSGKETIRTAPQVRPLASLSSGSSEETVRPTPQKHHSKPIKALGIAAGSVFALLCLLTSTNPNVFAHRSTVRSVVQQTVQTDMQLGRATQELYPYGTAADRIMDASLVYHNYYLCSLTSVYLRGKQQNVSLGICGMVFSLRSATP